MPTATPAIPAVSTSTDDTASTDLTARTLSRIFAMARHRAVWALVDQAVLSGGNFLTSYVVVRALPEAVYGEYALVLTFVLFLNNLHMALVTYPLSVTAAIGSGADLADHARRAMRLTMLLFVPLGLVLAGATAISAHASVVPWAILALVLWQLQETARRSMMARLQNHRAIAGDAISYLGQAAIVLVLAKMDLLTVQSAFMVIAATSAAALLVQAVQLDLFDHARIAVARLQPAGKFVTGVIRRSRRVLIAPSRGFFQQAVAADVFFDNTISAAINTARWAFAFRFNDAGSEVVRRAGFGSAPSRSTAVAENWTLGKWVLLSNLVNVLTFYSAPWVLTYFHGKEQFALLSVVAMLLNASNPVLSTVSGLVTPAVAKTDAEKGPAAARRAVVPYALMGLALLLPYYGLLAVVPHWVLVHFKPHSQYTELAAPVRIYVGIYLLLYCTQVLAGYLCGLGRSNLPFYAQAAAALVTAVVTLPLTIRFGLMGAAWGGLIPMVAQLLVCGYFAAKVAPDKRI